MPNVFSYLRGYRPGGALGIPEPTIPEQLPPSIGVVYADEAGRLRYGEIDVEWVDIDDPNTGSVPWASIAHWKPIPPEPAMADEPAPEDQLHWREGPPPEADAVDLRGTPFLAVVRTPHGEEIVLGEFGIPGDFEAHELAEIVRWVPITP